MVARAADMVEVALAEGMPAAIERFHASEPGARARRRHERRVAEAAPADATDEVRGVSVPTELDRLIVGAPALAAARRALADGRAAGALPLARPAWPFALAALARESARLADGGGARRRRGARPLAGAGRPDGPRGRRPLAHPRRRRRRGGGPVASPRGTARPRPRDPRPARDGRRRQRARGRRAGGGGRRARRPWRWRSAIGSRWTSWSTGWSRWATSGSPRWRSAATCRCAAGSSTCTPPPPTCPRASSCSATRSRACGRSRRSPSAPSARSRACSRGRPPSRRGRPSIPSPSPGSTGPSWCGWPPASTGPRCARPSSGWRTRPPPAALSSPEAVEAELAALSALDLSPPAGAARGAFDAVEARFATRSASEAEAELGRLGRAGLRVIVAFARRGDMSRSLARMERLRPVELEAGDIPSPGAIGASVLGVRAGLVSRDLGIAIVPEERVLRRRRPSAQRGPVVGKRLASFLDLKVGDHVVHEDHGIGRLTGFETRTVAGLTRDYLALAFADGDRLYVPHDQLDRVTRYVGADGSPPALSKLGRQGMGPDEVARPGRGPRDGGRADLPVRGTGGGDRLRLPGRRRAHPRARAALRAPRDARPAARHRRRGRRHGAPAPDGPPDLRRRGLRQDRDRHARRLQVGRRRQAGAGAGADDDPRPAAPGDVPGALRRPAGDRGHGQPLPDAGRDARGPVALPRRPPGHPHRHAPPAVHGRAAQGPRPGDRGRGAALRRGPEGVAAPAAPAGGRARDERDADPADAPDLAVGPARHQRHRDPAAGPAPHRDPRRRVRRGAGGRGPAPRGRARRPELLPAQPGRDDRRGRGGAAAPWCPSCGS